MSNVNFINKSKFAKTYSPKKLDIELGVGYFSIDQILGSMRMDVGIVTYSYTEYFSIRNIFESKPNTQ